MKSNGEIQTIQGLANIAATLLSTGHLEAKDAAQPILAMIKSQFHSTAEAPATQAEDACNQFEASGPNAHYDPIAAAAEELRIASRAREEAVELANKAEIEAQELHLKMEQASRAASRAQALLVGAIEATNRE